MKLNSIQLLRGVAALLVVYAHAIDLQMDFSVSKQQNFYFLQNFGAIGVDIFFAISGFVITFVANSYTGVEKGREFFKKRFIRINPFYYAASFIYLMVIISTRIWIIKQPLQLTNLKISGINTIFVLPPNKHMPLLTIGWTLSFEWLFYMLLLLLIFLKVRNKPLALMGTLSCLLLTGCFFTTDSFWFVFLTNPIIAEFLLGVIICWLYFSLHISKRIAGLCIVLGLLGYCYNIFYGYGNVSEVGYILNGQLSAQRVVFWGMPSALLVAGCVFLEKEGIGDVLWNNRYGKLIGDASYSIYLIHLTVYFIVAVIYEKWGFFLNPDLSIFMHLGLALLSGIAFYVFFEKPLLNYLYSKFIRKNKFATLPAV